MSIKVGTAGHKHEHKNIKTLRFSYVYASVSVMYSGDVVGISISERLSVNQRALYAYVNHCLTEHNTDICINRSRGMNE